LAEVLITAQQRHETGHSFIAQHFHRLDDGCAGQSELSLQRHQGPLSDLIEHEKTKVCSLL